MVLQAKTITKDSVMYFNRKKNEFPYRLYNSLTYPTR